MNFVFQKEFSKHMDSEGVELEKICKKHGINFNPITIRPFEHSVVESDLISNLEGYTVAYGSNAMRDVVATYKWKPGCFETAHDEKSVSEIFGREYINHDMILCNTDNYLEVLDKSSISCNEFFFMKPVLQKFFAGTIVDRKMMPFVIESQGRHFGSPDMYDLCIAPVKNIEAEWRFFVVDGNIIDGSKYHGRNLVLDVQSGYDPRAGEYAKEMTVVYDKNGTYVLDVAKMQTGEYKVVEINSLNSSGFYKISKEKLLLALKERN